MTDVPWIERSLTAGSTIAASSWTRLTALLEQIERRASLTEQPAQDPERAAIACMAAECFWGDP